MSTPSPNEIRLGIIDHVDAIWTRHPKTLFPPSQASAAFGESLRIIRIAPQPENPIEPWVYLSIGAWEHTQAAKAGIELMLLTPAPLDQHVSSLTQVLQAHYDREGGLRTGDIVPLNDSWLPNGSCDHLLVTLPYPYGPILEECNARGYPIRILWLLPITSSEAAFARREGVEALESRFEARAIDFMKVDRRSLA